MAAGGHDDFGSSGGETDQPERRTEPLMGVDLSASAFADIEASVGEGLPSASAAPGATDEMSDAGPGAADAPGGPGAADAQPAFEPGAPDESLVLSAADAPVAPEPGTPVPAPFDRDRLILDELEAWLSAIKR
jgi:hypothetical protein